MEAQRKVVLPNFLIIGAAQCGTTTLHSHLREHPDIYLPASKRPEPHFFLKGDEYARGLSHYSERHFSEWHGQTAVGEISTSYIYHEAVAERIRMHLPKVKLIAILRNPVDRAYSNYWHTVKSGLETLSFEEAVLTERERTAGILDRFWREVQPYAYVGRGFYYKQLSSYLRYFRRERMLILLFDDLVGRPAGVLRDIFGFLGIDEGVVPSSLDRVENRLTSADARMRPETRRKLLEWYREDTERLSNLLNRDLGCWNK
jgi:hypothetical protein